MYGHFRIAGFRTWSSAQFLHPSLCTSTLRTLTASYHTFLVLGSVSTGDISPRKQQQRGYASKKGKNKDHDEGKKQKFSLDTSSLVPGSRQLGLDAEAMAEYERAEAHMKAAVDWFRREVGTMEARGVGRVTPELLHPVRVNVQNRAVGDRVSASATMTSCALTDVATVGVREGTTLIVTVFDENILKDVEKGIYAAKIPAIVPQRMDSRTIKIPIPKPTVETRNELVKTAAKTAEETRMQLRKHEQTSVRRGKYGKYSIEYEQFQELTRKFIKEVDKILASMKQKLGVK